MSPEARAQQIAEWIRANRAAIDDAIRETGRDVADLTDTDRHWYVLQLEELFKRARREGVRV